MPLPPLLAAGDSWFIQWGLFLLGVALVTTALLFRYRTRRNHAANSLTAREQMERRRQERGVRGDLETLMVEIEQLAKRMGAQLDAKAVRVESLLREADERIARLEELRQERPPQAPSSPPPDEPTDPLTRSVLELAEEGLAAPDIARRLDEHVGKVELILALQRAR